MRRGAAPLVLLAALALAACETTNVTQAEAGWSRAPDLTVFAAMEMYGGIAREQSMLCGGFRPEVVRERWAEDFGPRTEAVTAALVARHGAEAVQRAALAPTRRTPCPDVPDLSWRHQYARMLRLLEIRLGLA
jgi:hypothetical protein